MDLLRRRKRLVLGLAAGAAGAAAAYYWWSSYANNKSQQQRSVEMELSAILRGSGMQAGAEDGGDGEAGTADGSGEADGDDCGSPDLDESLDSHFNYIQQVSAPQELSGLLPRLKETLFRLTDVALVKKMQQQQQEQGAAGGGVQEQLRLLACLCFGRTVAAAYMLPLMDLCVRTKLNVIGRHLFLQEKFSKLRQPAAPAARMRLPPRLTAAAAESFLACEQLAERGCTWLAEQAMAAADHVMRQLPMDAAVTPEELAELVQAVAASMGRAVTAAGAASPTGSAWVDAMVGPSAAAAVGVDAAAAAGSAESYRRALSDATMVEELEAELRRVLCNYRFSEALDASVGQCLSTCAAHIHATFISQAANAARQGPAEAKVAPVAVPAAVAAPQVVLPAPSSPEPQPQVDSSQPAVSPFSSAAASAEGPPPTVAAAEPQSRSTLPAAGTSGSPAASPAATNPQRAGSIGGASARASLAAAAVAAMQPRPLARCLKAVQGACEPLFADAKEVSARIASLPPVMSLCAVAFAAPLEL